jgi:dGTPase
VAAGKASPSDLTVPCPFGSLGSMQETDTEEQLAPWAQHSAGTRGRRFDEQEHSYRTPYKRDRDRVIHSRAFRRLEYKTQVFVNHEGDHYRTRLTHSIEVSQIGRTVAAALGLNVDLVETLALSHDLGHPPFGHLGEEVLDHMMVGHGGFNHNKQTLRIVEVLEDRYPAFPGLNLTWEVREGIAKHSGPIPPCDAEELAEYDPLRQPPIEAQILDLVDEIAYNHHDIDDGLDSGLLDIDALGDEVELFGKPLQAARKQWPGATVKQVNNEALRGVINVLVSDLIETTAANLAAGQVGSLEDVLGADRWLVGLSPEIAAGNIGLKNFLKENLYRHQRIERMKDKSRRILTALCDRYLDNNRLLPQDCRRRIETEGLHRAVADYVAGMTDRYATEEYQRLFDPGARV